MPAHPPQPAFYLPWSGEVLLLLFYLFVFSCGATISSFSTTVTVLDLDPLPTTTSYPSQHPPTRFSFASFADKHNSLNTHFVKKGWGWIFLSFIILISTHPSFERATVRRARALNRFIVATIWWYLVTQWCFGPPMFDKVFVHSGGRCQKESVAAEEGTGSTATPIFTAAGCRKARGNWEGGFDISGHVFMLVLGSWFLVVELCLAVILEFIEAPRSRRRMTRGKGTPRLIAEAIGLGGSLAMIVVLLSVWMLLITAAFFHTWSEKFSGLVFALAGVGIVYVVPRGYTSIGYFFKLPDL